MNNDEQEQDYEVNIEVNKKDNGFRDAANDLKNNAREIFGLTRSKKPFVIMLLLAVILIFAGFAYFSKLYGEGNVANTAAGYIIDKEIEIEEAAGKGYYYPINKDIVEKYSKAINAVYDTGEYNSKLLTVEEEINRINKNVMANETRGDEIEFNNSFFEELFKTEDRKVWESYLVKMFRTEIASEYPRLSSYEGEDGTEDKQRTKKDVNGDYVAQGKVNIKRTKIGMDGKAGEVVELKFIPESELARLIQANDLSALDYYTLDTITGYLYYATYTRRQLTADGHEYQSENTLRRNWIPYRNLTATFNMPYNFLLSLLQITGNPEYVMAVADLVYSQTEITMMVQDQMTVTEETYTIENGVTVADRSWNNTANVYIQKAKTWCTDFEDDAEQDISEEESEYTNEKGRLVNKKVTNYKWEVHTVTEKRINHERFLGLWKNNNGRYTQGTLYNENGKEVAYLLPPDYIERSYPARTVTSNESGEDIDTLLDLLARYTNTQTHEKLMMYYWNIYSGKNVYDVDMEALLDMFNMGKFKTMLGASSYEGTIPEKLWYALKNAGYSANAASSVVAQVLLYGEKTFKNSSEAKLGLNETQYIQRVDNGTYTNFANDGVSFGLGKWSTKERKQGLYNYAKSKDKSVGDIDTQIEYIVAELDIAGTSKASQYAKYQLGMYGDSWKNAKTTEEAASIYYQACIKEIENMIDEGANKVITSYVLDLRTYASSLIIRSNRCKW